MQTQEPLDYEPQALGSARGARGYAAPHGPHTCNGCEAVWTGARAAHCASCHRTFATAGLFDAHRTVAGEHGACRDPEMLTHSAGRCAGERIMLFRDGMWRAPEMPPEEKAMVFGQRVS